MIAPGDALKNPCYSPARVVFFLSLAKTIIAAKKLRWASGFDQKAHF
jgi:hypothetical protein